MPTPTATPAALGVPRYDVQLATATDAGTERENNEDFCGTFVESDVRVMVVVADGVSGEEGGEIASRTAVDVSLKTYAESPSAWDVPKRLYRAVQQANIDIHDR